MQVTDMAKNDNLSDFLLDIADAIREKKGTSEPINAQNFSSEIASIETGISIKPKYTGHVDAEGLKSIGWDDDDIAYYQKYGVNWNEENDDVHKVTDDNKALYGVLTANNISTYKDRIVYLPKIDTSGKTSFDNFLQSCKSLVSIPLIDTSSAKSTLRMFHGCSALVCIPCLDLSNVTTLEAMFQGCSSLSYVPKLDTSSVTSMKNTFYGCGSLATLEQMDFSSVTSLDSSFYYCQGLKGLPEIDTHNVTTLYQTFYNCVSLAYLRLDMANVKNTTSMLNNTTTVRDMFLKNLSFNLSFSNFPLLSKESLLYTINNEAATSAITITLKAYAYERLANDADVVEALTNHPNITLASA